MNQDYRFRNKVLIFIDTFSENGCYVLISLSIATQKLLSMATQNPNTRFLCKKLNVATILTWIENKTLIQISIIIVADNTVTDKFFSCV